MKVTLTGGSINIATIAAVLENNSRVYIYLPMNNTSGIMVSRAESQFNGYKKQDCIEVKFYEEDLGDFECMATEYFNANMIEKAAMSAVERYNSTDPCEHSNYSVAFENTFDAETKSDIIIEMAEKNGDSVIDVKHAEVEQMVLKGLPVQTTVSQIDRHSQNYPKGMTVKELKELIKDWPETNEYGDDTLVFISTEGGLDCRVSSSWCTNVRTNPKGELVYDISLDAEERD